MTRGDIIGLIVSYIYAFGLLLTAEYIGKTCKWRQDFTRKIIHMGAGLWIWGVLLLFDNWQYGIIPFATFIALNFIFYKYKIFKSMDTVESTPGTVYFALSITILFVFFWRTAGKADNVPIAAAAIMAMTIGDALASIIGRKWGRNKYHIWGSARSLEGTAVMAVSSFIVIGTTLALLPESMLSTSSIPFSLNSLIIITLTGGITAAVTEAFSPKGTDNLFVPILSAGAMYLIAALVSG